MEVPNISARDTKATVMEEKDDGLKEVKSHKKKKGADSRSFGGLRLNNANSKVIWQQNKSLTMANPFNVLNGNGADMGESETQQKKSFGVEKWDVINESDTTDDEAGFTSFSTFVGGGNQLEDEDSDFYDGYEDQVVDLHGALKEYRGLFANLLKPNDTTNKIHFRTLVNDERVESVDCVLPKDAAAKVKSRYGNSIVGFFLGSDQVIDKGPWMIRKSPIILSKWSPSVSLKKGEVTKVPVWVKMYNVPVLAYSEDGLSLLATQIGKPIMLDAFTSSMCVESWGRISFARALIEIDAGVGLKKEGEFGHDTSLCPKRVCEEVPNIPARDTKATIMEEQDDDFKEVKSRKKKKGADSRSFGGLRLNKPNSKKSPVLKKWDVINESDTTNDEAGFTSFSTSVRGGNQLEDEDSDFYDGYEDQVVDLHGALKEYRDFMLCMSERKKSRGSNIVDSDNTGDEGNTVGGAIGACGGISDSLPVALYTCMTFIYESLWKGKMASEAKRYLENPLKDQERCFSVRLRNSLVKLEYSQECS
nr:hypothetical protein [Tanacetum cinerariifolium]